MTNKELYDKAIKAINDLFGDISVSQEEARENLQGLMEEIGVMIDSLEE